MAIYHFHGQVIGRITKDGNPKSPLSSAAYRSGEKLHDELDNKTWSYTREVQPEAHILAPSHAPEWATNREKLWNEVNKIEKNYNATLAREFNIGLPRELNHEQQRELALEFCQEAFVDRGMVADIAIHRDDENNPHFHVMLTVRPFNEDGSWGVKAKREYLYDENGNHILDKNGKKAFRKVDTTDWKSKDVFLYWRKLWADKANEHLRKNGINETISHLSNKARNIEELPTIHEGYASRQRVRDGKESDRINTNKKIKEYNKTVADLNKYKEKKSVQEYQNKFARKFSPMEKKILSNVAKELKMFVDLESIEERKQQLKQWKKSIQFRKDSDTKLSQLERIEKEEVLVAEALEVFETEAKRFLNQHYSNIDYSGFSIDEKIAIVENTILHNRILSLEQINEIKTKIESENIIKEINHLIKNRFAFTLTVKEEYRKQETVVNKAKHILKLSESPTQKELNKAKIANPEAYKLYVIYSNKKDNTLKAYALMHQFYDLEIRKNYPNINIENMSLEQKELLAVGTEYYEKPITLESIPTLRRYTTEDQINIIRILTNNHGSDWETRLQNKDKYPNFQFDNPRFVLLFKDECLRNIKELPDDERQLLQIINPEKKAFDNLTEEFNIQSLDSEINKEINEFTKDVTKAVNTITGVTGAMFQGLLESRNFDSKKQFEEDLKTKSKSKSKKRNIHSSGPSL